jgi:hypothetical protein
VEDFGGFFAAGDLQFARATGRVKLVAVRDPSLGLRGNHFVAVEGGRQRASSGVFGRQAGDPAEAVVFDALCAIRRGFAL